MCAPANIFIDNVSIKQPQVLNIHQGMFSWLNESKDPTGFEP